MIRLVERLDAFNQGRDPKLLHMKYQAMQRDAFAFYRGTCHLFYEDWPKDTLLDNVPATWICGDLHLQNLGSYKADNRIVYFNINDFDESVLAPGTWDLARFLTSLLVAAPTMKIKRSEALALCKAFLETYTTSLLKGSIRPVDEENAVGIVYDLLEQVERRRRKDFLDARTTFRNDGRTRKLRIDNTHTLTVTEAERTTVSATLEHLTASPFFHVIDLAHRVAGVGSLGIDRYAILVEGRGSPHRNYLLDLKEACPSSLEPYLRLKQPSWLNQAERSVAIRRWMQGIPPALLSAVEMNGRSYVLRELQPTEDKVDLLPLVGKARRLEQLVKTIANVIAWGQLRSGGIQGSAIVYDLRDFAKAPRWQKHLLNYAQFYAEHVEEDYHTFVTAMKHGAFSTQEKAAASVEASGER